MKEDRVYKRIWNAIMVDKDSDLVKHGAIIKFERIEDNEIVFAVNTLAKWAQPFIMNKKAEARLNTNRIFQTLIPIEMGDITPKFGISRSPIINSRGEIVGVYGFCYG
jgi:hypothetical protein